MIITRTPYRVSFFGGGTDYPAWFREHGGTVLGTTIDKYCYITCRYLPPFFEHRSRVVYSRIENVSTNGDIAHPAVRGVLGAMGIEAGVEIHHDGDLPARTGIGSSSAFTVGLLHAAQALTGVMPTRMELAREAIRIEQDVLQECVGCQDQVFAAFGGLLRIDFAPDGDIRVAPIVLTPARLEALKSHLLLYFTGFARTASEIAREQVARTPSLTRELGELQRLVPTAQDVLCGSGDLMDFGRLLHEAWSIKRHLTPHVSNANVDDVYARARSVGAAGGKLLGAGGGGFMLLFAPPDRHAAIRTALESLLEVPFGFDRGGSELIVYQPDRGAQARADRARATATPS